MTSSDNEESTAQYKDFLFSYRFEGAEYGFTVPALNMDEAKARLSAMGLARYDGEIFATIKVPEKFGVGAMIRKLFGVAP